MRLGGFCVSVSLAAALLVSFVASGGAQAAEIANWDKSNRSWNNLHMTKVKLAMQNAGHRVIADSNITNAALTRSSVYVIAEPTATPTVPELNILRQFVTDGGMILVFGDTGIDLPTYNSLLASLGSSLAFTTTTIGTSSALPVGQFTEFPWKISGSSLSVTSGNGTSGGTLIDNNYVRYEQIGTGFVVVFGDRIDHNDVISDINARLLINLVSVATAPAAQIPTFSLLGIVLASLLLAGLGVARLARRRR